MGSKQSVPIEAPEFNPEDWEYCPAQADVPEEFGQFRTLRHRRTGEKIDEYSLIWPNEEEYSYYLKSFNWRSRQPNVVNTRFLREHASQEICSQRFMARVYVEHIRVRLSEISDIPFPDNLYVLMEAFEGFAKIYEHSKYFQVEENQICVDELGNLKIWVNADLSVNYPPNQGFVDYCQKGQEEMVDLIVAIVASNTDPETEPAISFRDFYEQKKGRGKRFEEAKVLVLNYARLHDTDIPDKFEAIVNMDKEEADFSENLSYRPNQPRERVHYLGDDAASDNTDVPPALHQSQPSQALSFGAHSPHFYPQPAAPVFYQQLVQPQHAPIYFIPSYPRVEHRLPPPSQSRPSFHPQPLQHVFPQQFVQSYEALPAAHREEAGQSQGELMRATLINSLGQEIPEGPGYEDQAEEKYTEQEARSSHKRNRSYGNSISEADDLVARSLPIKAGGAGQGGQLAAMGQERAIYSHISPKDQFSNKDGFGLTQNPQLKLKESGLSQKKGLQAAQSWKEVQPIKYFYSLEEELEIDPDIAADMAKYLS